MKTFPILVVAALLTLANTVHAQFQANDKQTVTMILAWLQAFYTDANAKPVVDFDRMKVDGGKLAEYCAKNPSHVVIIAADNVMEKK